jgi:hypothetical protein
MSSNSRFYYSLPTEAPRSRSGSRRPPLTPSTVSSPLLTTHAPMVTRRDSGSGSPTKASVLLAKVASQPTSLRGETPTTSPMSSPTQRTVELHSSPIYTPDRPSLWRSESARYVRQYRYQGMHPLMTAWLTGRMLTYRQTATSAFRTLRSFVRLIRIHMSSIGRARL